MNLIKNSLMFLLAFGLLATIGCDDDDVSPVSVTAITATGTDLLSGDQITVDLNASTAAENVPLDAVISITFARAIDVSTVNSTSVTLMQGGSAVAATVNASGSTATLTPTDDLERGLMYTLNLSGTIQADDGGSFTTTSRTFTAAGRAGVTPPQDNAQTAYYQLNGDALAAVGGRHGTETGITYGADRFGEVESAAYFDGDVSLIEFPNSDDLMTQDWTLSFWMKIDSAGHNGGHFVMGLGDVYGFFIEVQGHLGAMKLTARYEREDGTTTANDFFFNGDGMDAMNGGWVGIEYEIDLTATGGLGAIIDDQWAHLVLTYNSATNKRSLYVNGVHMETDNMDNTAGLNDLTGLTFDASGAGADVIGTALAFGFNHDKETTHWSDTPWGDYNKPDANHFKGWLDDVRFFSAAYTQEDVTTLYNAESN